MDFRSKQIIMERVEVPQLHEHPLIPFTRFAFSKCKLCSSADISRGASIFGRNVYIYGGYRCNELGCESVVFHKECVKPVPEINHSSHPNHSLKLINIDSKLSRCTLCGFRIIRVGYCCSICDFNLDLTCARRPAPLVLPENSYGHEHPLQLTRDSLSDSLQQLKICKGCDTRIHGLGVYCYYTCYQCEYFIHLKCLDVGPEAYHTSHPQHPLKSLRCHVPDYADKKCLLCGKEFDEKHHQLHHCDVCNFSICRACMKNPPPVVVECPRTHQHQLHLVPRLIHFTCNACGTLGDRSPYFCLLCNFMIHWECIGLPRVININRHDHRISYTRRLGGPGEWKCKVCRKNIDGFYGAYTCSKCQYGNDHRISPSFAVHSICATREDVWDMVELEGTPEEEEIPPFEVVDKNTIKHFSHDHNLQINNDGRILPESTLCEACVFQICSEPFYSCKQCDYVLHEKCANLPRKKRHVRNNKPFTLRTDSHFEIAICWLCDQYFTGFRYESGPYVTIDVRCASISDSLAHESHPDPLYYTRKLKPCSRCGSVRGCFFSCDECEYNLDAKCALLPEKVMKNRYDDHPLFLSYGDKNVDGEYWCEACETRVNPNKGFYACNNCGVVLHISCIVGDFSYIMLGSVISCVVGDVPRINIGSLTSPNEEVVSNTSICRPLCYGCNSRCKLPSILKLSKAGVDVYVCSLECRNYLGE